LSAITAIACCINQFHSLFNFLLSDSLSFAFIVVRLGLPMARYTSLFTVSVSFDRLRQLLTDILESCNFNVIYDTEDYLVAREVPGQVSFAKLVTVEVLIDKFREEDAEVRMNFVVKNEELPLKTDNHCRRKFNLVNQAVAESRQWQLLESVAS
jgi:hypothetical protein